MKISCLKYYVEGLNYNVPLESDSAITVVVSNDAAKRQAFIAGMEIAFYGWTENSFGSLVEQSVAYLDNGRAYGGIHTDHSDQECGIPADHEDFLNHVLGKNALDLIEYFRNGEYIHTYDLFLCYMSGNRMCTIGWDFDIGMVIENRQGKCTSIFCTSVEEQEMLRLAARITDLDLGRYPLQVITVESLAMLNPEHLDRFYSALMDTLRPEMQVIFVWDSEGFLSSPLADVKDVCVVDLDEIKQERGA